MRIHDWYNRAFHFCDGRFCGGRLTPHKKKLTVSLVSLLALLLVFHFSVYRAPPDFPEGEVITVSEGLSVRGVADLLERKSVVRSARWLTGLVRIFGDDAGVRAGDYYFTERIGLFSVARRIMAGAFSLEPIHVTLYEGQTREQMAAVLARTLPAFDEAAFLALSEGKEGYLFPDTYRFLPTDTAERVIRAMEKNFFEKIQTIENDIARFGHSLDDVVVMASLLEREARTIETRRTIAGILWKRLELGMPLQVDAVFVYILGKGSADLTLSDLAVDSPYNTYKYLGLPPAPIANPGLDALRAAVTPITTDYFYFLSDREGTMHYAVTFDEHKQNKARYLR